MYLPIRFIHIYVVYIYKNNPIFMKPTSTPMSITHSSMNPFLRTIKEKITAWESLRTFNHNWLVVLTILKNMKVNGKDYPIYYGK